MSTKQVFDILSGKTILEPTDKNKWKYEEELFGYLSGDYECFCFDVPLSEYIRITGRKPEKHDKSWFNKKTYRIYLSDIVKILQINNENQFIVKMKIELERIKKPFSI